MKEFVLQNGPYLEKEYDKSNHILIKSLIVMIFYRLLKEGIIPFLNLEISFLELFLPLLLVTATILLSYGFYYFGEHFLVSRKEFREEECLIDGILLGLLLPIYTPIFIIIIAAFLTVIIGRYFYQEKVLFVPVLIGILGAIGISVWMSLCRIETRNLVRLLFEYTEFFEVDSLSLIAIWNGFVSEWISKTSPILCLIILFYLWLQKVIKWRIPIYFIGSYLLLFLFQHIFEPTTGEFIIKSLGSGNLIFLSIFLASNTRTTPVTSSGQILFSIFLGIFTYYFNYFFNPFLGMIFAILIMNMLVPIFDYFGNFYQLKYCSEN